MSVMNPDIDNVVGYLQEVENSNWCFLNSITPYYGNITEENIRQACAYVNNLIYYFFIFL